MIMNGEYGESGTGLSWQYYHGTCLWGTEENHKIPVSLAGLAGIMHEGKALKTSLITYKMILGFIYRVWHWMSSAFTATVIIRFF
jgi:hypothetical protein